MRDWFSTSDLAALALPGFPATRGGWEQIAQREGWENQKDKVRARKGRGGGLEYHVELLSAEALTALAMRNVGVVDITAEDAARGDEKPFAPGTEGRDARLAIVSAADRFAKAASLSRIVGDRLFGHLYNAGQTPIEPWVRASVPKIAPRSLRRWRMLKTSGSMERLAVDRGANRRGKGALDAPEIRQFILSRIAHQPWLSASHVQGLLQSAFPDKFSRGEPPERSIQYAVKKIKTQDAELLTRVTNPDRWNSKYRPTGTNSAPVSRLNELWMIDASPADVLCVDGRNSVYLCVDIFSRRLVVYVSRTPRAEAVALLMRRAILAWGVPERVKTDNGSDFKAKSTQRLFAALDIEIELSAPFAPWQKGHIERAVKTFQHDCAAILPGFVGHNVADRKMIEERKAFAQRLKEDDGSAFKVELTAKELQTICDEWAAGRYAQRPHSSLPKGLSPFAMAASYPGKICRVPEADIRALDLLLAPLAGSDGMRVVQKQGVRIAHSFYLAPNCLPGDRVFVRMDPEDMGRAWLFSADGEAFIGEAVCPELAGVDPQEALAKAKAMRKQMTEERLQELKADMRKISPREAVDALVRDKAREAGKLVDFPRPAEAHDTASLAAAREALGEAPTPAARDEELIAKAMQVAPIAKLPETKQMRFRRALTLEAAIERGETISTEDALWLGGYQAGHEYSAMREFFQDFGEAALR